jgi:hypothetical protein
MTNSVIHSASFYRRLPVLIARLSNHMRISIFHHSMIVKSIDKHGVRSSLFFYRFWLKGKETCSL